MKTEFGAETAAHSGSKHTHFFLKDNTICQDLSHKAFHILLFHFLTFSWKDQKLFSRGLRARNRSFYPGCCKNEIG